MHSYYVLWPSAAHPFVVPRLVRVLRHSVAASALLGEKKASAMHIRFGESILCPTESVETLEGMEMNANRKPTLSSGLGQSLGQRPCTLL